MRAPFPALAASWMRAVLLAVLLAGCGAKSDLSGPGRPPPDAAPDASRRDAAVSRPDGGTGLPDGARPDARACPRPCDDGLFCDGREYCEESTGACAPGLPVDCDDRDPCTIDACDPARAACTHVPSDRDEDADGISSCGGDCDDADGTVFPGAAESCNERDDDCDGDVDEGVLSECRDCRPGCRVVDMPREVVWAPGPDDSAGVELAPDGSLVLSTTRTELTFAWIANSEEGTLTKLDTRDGTQAAEYDSVLTGPANGARPAAERCVTSAAGGNCPSRTAVDLRGAVYVGNRAFFAQGTVTKIAGALEDCVDRDRDGRVETSEDRDGDGIIERGVRGEYLGQDDECILWTVDVGGRGSIPRAIAVAADGTVWVGLHGEQRVLQLAASDGRVLRAVSLSGRSFSPYGAAIGSDGVLWLTEAANGKIVSIDTSTGTAGVVRTARSSAGCSGSYGIAIDHRDRVWLAGLQCTSAFRFDPASASWMEVPLPDSGAGRGIAADDRGYVYVAASHEWIGVGVGGFSAGPPITRVTRFRADDGSDVRIWGTAAAPLPGLSSTGIGLDHERRMWLVNQASASATRVDPTTGEVREFAVGDGPYTYSDFTGYALRTFTAPNGYLRTVVEGCAVGPTEWEQVTWDADVPARTRVEIRVRTAASRAALATATFVGPFTGSPSDLALPPGPVMGLRFIEIEVTLVSEDERRSPRLRAVSVQYNCPV